MRGDVERSTLFVAIGTLVCFAIVLGSSPGLVFSAVGTIVAIVVGFFVAKILLARAAARLLHGFR